MTTIRVLVASCVIAALIGAGVAWSGRHHDGASGRGVSADPQSAIRTDLPVTAPSGEPKLDGLVSAGPAPGTVVQVAGPFDDRFLLADLAFDGRFVSGVLTVTSDVSDVLELQVLAGFYDRRGAFLGEARYSYHLDEDTHTDAGPPDESLPFRVRVPRDLGGSVAAAVGVPVLVNE